MKKLFLLLLVSFYFSSCTDYLDVNGDQTNNVFTDQLLPKNTLAAAITGYTSTQCISMNDYGNKMSYFWGLNFGFTTADPAYSYLYTSSSFSNLWEGTYLNMDRFQNILDGQAKFPNYNYHYAIAGAMKVNAMQYVLALYGDAPYSQAFDNFKYPFPKYDDDKAVYRQLFLDLDKARINLATTNPLVEAVGAEDPMFRGDMDKWRRFINTIELRMLVRLSKTTDTQMIALRTSRFAALEKDFVDFDVAANPGYNRSTLTQYTPMYRVWGLNEALNAWTSSNRANASGDYANKVLLGTMNNANITTGVADPRRPRIFTSGPGNIQGQFPIAACSRLAGFVHGAVGGSSAEAGENGAGRDAYLMLAAESYFLQAEAQQRGYMAGSAQASFNAGISASFKFYSRDFGTAGYVPISVAPSLYISVTNPKNGLGWAGSADKLNAIMTQKWLALGGWSGIEPYLDNLRTGFPVLPLPIGVSKASRPNRLIYPASEYSSNSVNVITIFNDDLFTVSSKTPFYLQ